MANSRVVETADPGFSPFGFAMAATKVAGPSVGNRAREVMARRWPTLTRLSYEQAGEALAAALMGDNPDYDEIPGGLFLSGAHAENAVYSPTDLTPDEARDHPLTRDWFAETAGEALAVAFSAVVTAQHLAPGRATVPLFTEFDVYTVPGATGAAYGAVLSGVFPDTPAGEVFVSLTFGAPGRDAAVKPGVSLSGAALVEIARQAAIASRPEVEAAIITAGNAAIRAAGGVPPLPDPYPVPDAAEAAAMAADAAACAVAGAQADPDVALGIACARERAAVVPIVGAAAVSLMGEEAAIQLCEIIGEPGALVDPAVARRMVAEALLRGACIIPGPERAQ